MRNMIAETILNITPTLPNYGPPLPRYFQVKWPQTIYNKMPRVVHEASRMYNGALQRTTSMIRGY